MKSVLAKIEALESRTLSLYDAVTSLLADKRLTDMAVRGEVENALVDLRSTSQRLQAAYFNEEGDE